MSRQEEVTAGIGLIVDLARQNGCVLSHRSIDGAGECYFDLSRDLKNINFTLSKEYLATLATVPAYRDHAKEALSTFATRFRSAFPNDFYSKLGAPLSLEILWPVREHPSRDVVWVKVNVTDIRYPKRVAKTCAVIDLFLDDSKFESAPFARIPAVVNAIREELDRSNIEFYEPKSHPSLLQEIAITEISPRPRLNDEALQQFLSRKVYWLGFRRGGQSTPVWIADPWDASYLGVSTGDLTRAAQIVQARGLLSLSEDQQFATANDMLIITPVSTHSISANPIGFAP